MPSHAVDELFGMLGEPPSEIEPVPWEQALPEAGLVFPSDYREIIDRYGTFEIYRYLTVWGPFRGRPQSDMSEGFVGHAEFSREEAETVLLPENHTQPSADGELITGPDVLQRWGANIAGDRFFWLTEGDPEHWPIAVWFRGGPWVVLRAGLARFLVDLLNRTLPRVDRILPVQGPENPDWDPGDPVPPLLKPLGGW
jgi:hypothetical protein